MSDSFNEIMFDAAENFKYGVGNAVSAVSNTFKGSTQVLDTGVTSGLDLTRNTLQKSMETAGVVQEGTNDSIQRLVKTGVKGIDAAGGITENTFSFVSGTTGEALNQAGMVTSTSIKTAGTALNALFGTANNMAARKVDSVNARNEADRIRAPDLTYEQLRQGVLDDFNTKINKFIENFNTMISSQQKLLKSVLNIYKLKKCKKGMLYGTYCSSDISAKANEFEKDLQTLLSESKSQIVMLESLKTQAYSDIFDIPFTMTTEEYKQKLAENLSNLTSTATGIFTSTLEMFKILSLSLEAAEKKQLKEAEEKLLKEAEQSQPEQQVQPVNGGKRRKRKTRRRKMKKSKKSKKSKKNRKH